MTGPDRIADLRGLRDQARALVEKDVAALRSAIDSRPIGQRIKDAASGEVTDAVDTARAVAAENKTVVGLTLAALAGWALRRPLAGLAHKLGTAIADKIAR